MVAVDQVQLIVAQMVSVAWTKRFDISTKPKYLKNQYGEPNARLIKIIVVC